MIIFLLPTVGKFFINKTTNKREYRFSLPSVWNDILNKKTQESPHKETAQTRVEVKHINPPKTTAYLRVRLPSKQKTLAPT